MDSHNELFLQAMNTDHTVQNVHDGILKGKVVGKEESGFFVSIGGKSEMLLPLSETVGSVAIGDELDLVQTGTKEGIAQVSQKKAQRAKVYENIEQSLQNSTPLEAKVVRLVTNKEGLKSGFLVSIDGVEAFLPMSHVRIFQDEDIIDKIINVVTIKVDRDRFVVSEKLIKDQLQKENFAKFVASHEIGDRISVTVVNIGESFALVSFENLTMFLHITEFDWRYVKTLSDVLKVGDKFDVIVVHIDESKHSIKVSRKGAMQSPMKGFLENYSEGSVVCGTATRFTRNFVILETEEGVDMILPVSEMSWVSRVSDPKQLLQQGDRVEVKIKEIHFGQNKIVVSLRELLENPWMNAAQKYACNTVHEGRIVSITDFGIFLAFDDGIQGLVRIEDIDWNNKSLNLNDWGNINDRVQAVVLFVDSQRERLQLGIKQLAVNPIQDFANNYKIGSLVSGKISKLLKDGVEIELEKGLKAFMHISQISSENVADVNDVFKLGDLIEAAVRRIHIQKQSIELSIKELTQAEEKKEIDKYMKSGDTDVPTLGSMFGNILKK